MSGIFADRVFTVDDFDLQVTAPKLRGSSSRRSHSPIGTGTFGRVRLVKLKGADNTPYALKILHKSEIIRLKQVEHVKAEKEILRMLSHPFIVNMLTHFKDDKNLYLLLEYINGGELFTHLRKNDRMPNEHAKFYAAEIICAFQYIHSINVVYRDLKPENLLITQTGHLKITDFGFAKIVEDRTWTLCGTPEYLAPEIIQSKGYGKSADWWALGILVFEMLAGYPPFFDENPFGIYQKVLAGRIDFPRHFDIKAKDLIKRLLTYDRTKRYGCMKNGAEDIKKHKWFKGIDWNDVYNMKLTPPFLPEVTKADDTSLFDKYPESVDTTYRDLAADEQIQFNDF